MNNINDKAEREHLANEFLDIVGQASPETLNAATIKWRKKGGKFAVLADVLSGLISVEEADHRWDKLIT